MEAPINENSANKPKEIYALHEPIDFMNQKRIQIDTGSCKCQRKNVHN
ncbi:hypothetical protein [Mammaliicoccus sciuri]|nr:hypothetical protein [Mammaliicoccus sciuri]MEB6341982.1 hypothetical protein [Mammaliicoccus sciuri]